MCEHSPTEPLSYTKKHFQHILPGRENIKYAAGSLLCALKLCYELLSYQSFVAQMNIQKAISIFLFFKFSSLRGEASSPIYSPRCELVAAAKSTQIRIYRVHIDDRSSASANMQTEAAASLIIYNVQILKNNALRFRKAEFSLFRCDLVFKSYLFLPKVFIIYY